MTLKSFLFYFVGISMCLTLNSCKKDNPDERVIDIAADFEPNGTWFFKSVTGKGLISGVETEDDDPNPGGFITFNDDGTGVAEFSLNLLNRDYGKREEITWERPKNNEIVITESDGDIDVWVLIRANKNVIEADWEKIISPENRAVFTATMTPNP